MQYQALYQFFQKVVPLSANEWELIARHLVVRKLSKGEHWLQSGEVCRSIAFVHTGLLRIYYNQEGKEHIAQFFMENEFVADYAGFLSQEAGVMYIDALEDAELWLLSYDSLQRFYQQIPIFERFGRIMAEAAFVRLHRETIEFMLLSADERYRQLNKTRPQLLQRVPQYLIAAFLGIEPETLSRIRKRQTVRIS